MKMKRQNDLLIEIFGRFESKNILGDGNWIGFIFIGIGMKLSESIRNPLDMEKFFLYLNESREMDWRAWLIFDRRFRG